MSKKVDILSVNPIDPNADIGAIKRANAAKIPVLVHNGITPLGGGVKVVEYIGYNQWKGAKLVGEEACKLWAAKAKSSSSTASSSSTPIAARADSKTVSNRAWVRAA